MEEESEAIVAETSVEEELAKIDQADAIVKLAAAGYLDLFNSNNSAVVPIADNLTPSLAKGLAVGGAAA